MAKKMNALQVMEAGRAEVEIEELRHAPLSPALYMMQLQLPQPKTSPLKRKLPVIMDADTRDAVPQPVKIIHLV